jgi:hypothetical protein
MTRLYPGSVPPLLGGFYWHINNSWRPLLLGQTHPPTPTLIYVRNCKRWEGNGGGPVNYTRLIWYWLEFAMTVICRSSDCAVIIACACVCACVCVRVCVCVRACARNSSARNCIHSSANVSSDFQFRSSLVYDGPEFTSPNFYLLHWA